MQAPAENTARLYGTLMSMHPAANGVWATLRLDRCVPLSGELPLRQPALGRPVEVLLEGVREQALMPGLRLVVAAHQAGHGPLSGDLLR